MNIRKSMLASVVATAFLAPVAALAASITIVDVAPPPSMHEEMAARQGYIITPGYYRYDEANRAPTWVKGSYQAERHGEHYVASEWREQDGRYHFNEGRWEHDK